MNEESPQFCPYKGLQPFTATDSEYFFGREEEQDVVTSNLEVAPLTILYGASGVGKTSVLMAGVVTRLQQKKEAAVIFFRDWQNAEFISALKKETLASIKRTTGSDVKVDESKSFSEFLMECSRNFRGPLLFIFDQFEEYFLYHQPSQRNGRPATNSRVDFDIELARAINRRDLSVNFLLSLREDGLSKLDRLQTRIPNLLGNLLRLDHLNLKAASDAVRKPLEVYNRKRPDKPPVKVQAKLVEKLLQQVQTGQVTLNEGAQGVAQIGKADTGKIETPFLQLVLERLWDAELERWKTEKGTDANWITVATLDRLGGAENIVRTHLDSVMERLADLARAQQKSINGEEAVELAADVFRFLVTPHETKIAHTAADLASFAELPESKHKPLEELLELLASYDVRILRRVDPPAGKLGGARYEIFHDVLAPAVLAWRARYVRDRKLIEAERQAEIERRRAEKEAKVAFRLRWLVVALTIVSGLAIAFGFYAVRLQAQAKVLQGQADEAKQSAVIEHREAERIKKENIGLQETAEAAEQRAADRIIEASEKEQQAKDATDKLLALRDALDKEKKEKATTRTINDKFQEAENAYNAGNTEEAIDKYKDTLPLHDQTGNLPGKAAVYSTIGRRYRELAFGSTPKNPDEDDSDSQEEETEEDESVANEKFDAYLLEAKNNLDEARKIYATLEAGSVDHMKEAGTLSFVGGMYVAARSYDEFREDSKNKEYSKLAVQYYDAALQLYRKAPNRVKEVVFSLERLAKVAPDVDVDKALEYNTELRRLYHQANQVQKEAAAFKAMGDIYLEAKRRSDALRFYKDAVPLYRLAKDAASEILTLIAIAGIYRDLNDQRSAIDTYLQLIVFEAPVRDKNRPLTINSTPVRAGWHSSLGELYAGIGEKQSALEQYNKAIAIYQKGYTPTRGRLVSPATRTRYQVGEARALSNIAKLEQELGNKQKAIESYTRALQYFQTHELYTDQIVVLRSIGEIYRSMGDEQKAADFFQKAKEIEATKIKDEDERP